MSDAGLRTFDRPPLPPPEAIRDVYLIGICGTGMGALAGLLKSAGYAVRGSDEAAYPPMSTHLAAQGIEVIEGYDAAHLDPAPDLVVVGNACRPTHPEAAYAREQGLVQASFPEALAHVVLKDPSRRPIVIAGTHGKTTTTALLVHTLRAAGADPGFLVGGVMQGAEASYALGTDQPFVVEGDEYDSAYFDKRPKFMHYRPARAVVTSLEYDHADIYPDEAAYRAAFERFAGTLGARDGLLALCGDHDAVAALQRHTDARVRTYGLGEANDIAATDVEVTPEGQRFTLTMGGMPRGDYVVPLHGRHNLQNALAVALLALTEGCSPQQIAEGFATFAGVKRRQEVVGEAGGVRVLDDFAHHPTAVAATLAGVRAAHPGRRLVAVFEPRSNTSRRRLFEDAYAEAFDAADRALLVAPPERHNDDPDAMLDAARVAARIRARGPAATSAPDADAALDTLAETVAPGDVVVAMSNGSFGGLPRRLVGRLQRRAEGAKG
jgi:UDP-N-acetylmuramate: L-alanyl-gamma-D-glutamyl-meso-diaminopimelate ligase